MEFRHEGRKSQVDFQGLPGYPEPTRKMRVQAGGLPHEHTDPRARSRAPKIDAPTMGASVVMWKSAVLVLLLACAPVLSQSIESQERGRHGRNVNVADHGRDLHGTVFRGMAKKQMTKRNKTKNKKNKNTKKNKKKKKKRRVWRKRAPPTPTNNPATPTESPPPTEGSNFPTIRPQSATTSPTNEDFSFFDVQARGSGVTGSRAALSLDGTVLAVFLEDGKTLQVYKYGMVQVALFGEWTTMGDPIVYEAPFTVYVDLSADGQTLAITNYTSARTYQWMVDGQQWVPQGQDIYNHVGQENDNDVACALDNLSTLSRDGTRRLLIVGCFWQTFDYDPINKMWIQVGQAFEAYLGEARQLSANGDRMVTSFPTVVYEWQVDGAVWEPLGSSPLGEYNYILHLSATGNRLAVYDDSSTTIVRVLDYVSDDESWVQLGQDIPITVDSYGTQVYLLDNDEDAEEDTLVVIEGGRRGMIHIFEFDGVDWIPTVTAELPSGENIIRVLGRGRLLASSGSWPSYDFQVYDFVFAYS